MTEPTAQDAERQQFYAALERQQMGPLWAVLGRTLTAQPPRREVPHLWSWREVRPQLLRAGALVTTAEAERRVLMFLESRQPRPDRCHGDSLRRDAAHPAGRVGPRPSPLSRGAAVHRGRKWRLYLC